ncbi:AMP-binding protein, partial [Flavobacterium sp. HJSW_4]|uniref:amino acid adenylation domain-containing protein n=1 Tax=Flavobacterium sp. HJSW_4 TaxID=3344660 RepID=UPI0035F45DDB
LSQIDLFKLHECKNSLQFASLSFDASISEIFITLLSGSSLYIINEETRKDIKLFESYIKENNIDIATLPPAYLKLLDVDSLQGLKVLITAGESADYDKVAEYLKFGTYYNAYGPTETSICGTIFKVEKGKKLNSFTIPIGTPISNTSIYIVDEFNNLQPNGIVGEICIGGSGLARGYLNQPELTSEKFITNPFAEEGRVYKTGDLGRWLPEGNIEFKGRIDEQVKIHGYRIELGEIEKLILDQHLISQCVVVAKEKGGEKYIVAYCVSKCEIDKKTLRNNLAKVLPIYMLPSYYIQLDIIPLTSNGKINIKNLPNLKEEDLMKVEFVAPRTVEEEILTSILCDILKYNQIGVKDNFYDLGGHSIVTIQLILRLKQLGYTITVEDVLEHSVIEDLAKFIKNKFNIETQLETRQDEFLNGSDFEDETIFGEDSNLKEWKYGDAIELSPNQLRFFKLPYLTNVLDFKISDYNEKTFEREFRLFLNQFPMLTLKYEKYKDQIFQRYISADEMKYKLLVEDTSQKELDEIKLIGDSFINAPWNLLNEELIRVFVVNSNNSKAHIFIGIPYSFIDLYSRNVLHSEIIKFFYENKRVNDYYHPFTFINQQKKFLESKNGIEERKHWVRTLSKIPMNDSDICVKSNVSESSIIQETFISGDNFEKIKNLSIKYSFPISAFLNSFYEMILSDYNNEDKKLYGALVNGRDVNLGKLHSSKIIGVINNMIPLTYTDYSGFTIEGIIKCYTNYLNAKKYQRIPYETICEDLSKSSGNELNKNIIGYFNFHEFENFKSINSKAITKTIKENNISAYDICLVCVLHPNGITLRMVCLNKIYKKNEKILSLEMNINRILNIVNQL